jgi:hypothetical protein
MQEAAALLLPGGVRCVVGKQTDIDRLYGLEPVIDAGEEAGNAALEQFVDLACPYCSELIQVRLDLSAGAQAYIEDCQVCCQPLQVCVEMAPDGQLQAVTAERLDR